MLSLLHHSPWLRRAPDISVWPAFAGVPRSCEECSESAAQAGPRRKWHVHATAPAGYRALIQATPYCSWHTLPDPMKGR
ncbi:MAG: hypothetical protein ACJ78Q_06025 [Chloroflexia bacterium]